MTETFFAKSGNVALCDIKGMRNNLEIVDVTWDHSPSKKDIRQCNEWWRKKRPTYAGVASIRIEDDNKRKAWIDEVMYGGQRN